jgi:signal peptidase II
MLVLLLSFAIVAFDQVTKYLVRVHFYPGEGVSIVPGLFNLAFVRNTGAAWGMFGGFNGWLALLSVVILALIVVFRRSFLTDSLVHRIALGLMVGGIIGNLIDRLRLQYVVDFLDFHWKAAYHFPAFNVADAAICMGVLLYMLSAFAPTSHPLNGNGCPAGPQAQDPADAERSTAVSGR